MTQHTDTPAFSSSIPLSIRDPLHKSIELSESEMAMLRDPAYQRLRGIKQIGFAEIPYPGATHTRYLHSIGVGAVATRMWRSLQRYLPLDPQDAAQFLRIVRAAAMLHDVGHAPLSHTTESLMPPQKDLALPSWLSDQSPERQAHHEDYSLKIILDSPISRHLEAMDVSPLSVSQLISGIRLKEDTTFHRQGIDFFPMMRQIISSEIDADRMDYLLRDAFYCGVAYGQFDLDWLLQHLTPILHNQTAYLGLRSRALFTFEDFLLSRYHMFFSVYYHHASICYQEMLQRFFQEEPDAFPLPADLDAYLRTDDAELITALRRSHNPWAQRITQHRPYIRLFEILLPSENPSLDPNDPDGPTDPNRSLSSLSLPDAPYTAALALSNSPPHTTPAAPSDVPRTTPAAPSDVPRTTPAAPSDVPHSDAHHSAFSASPERPPSHIPSIQLYSTFPKADPHTLLQTVALALQEAQIPIMQATSRWVLSRYFRQPHNSEPPIYVLDDSLQAAQPIQQYSHLYRRYAQAQSLRRIYCHPRHFEQAQRILQHITSAPRP
ncbi:HD domain-containing protein [Myxococcota bacterium]|nr:HD domain-containing protein [Myxococcota bacterium]